MKSSPRSIPTTSASSAAGPACARDAPTASGLVEQITPAPPTKDDSWGQLFSRADLKNLGVSYSNPHLIKLEREGRFPKRLVLSPGKVAWFRREVIAWIEAKAAERKVQEPP